MKANRKINIPQYCRYSFLTLALISVAYLRVATAQTSSDPTNAGPAPVESFPPLCSAARGFLLLTA